MGACVDSALNDQAAECMEDAWGAVPEAMHVVWRGQLGGCCTQLSAGLAKCQLPRVLDVCMVHMVLFQVI